ncbi:hypothetical protein AB7W75_12550, partial [Providencia huaxiensis]
VGSFSHLCCWTNYPSQKCAVPLNQIIIRQALCIAIGLLSVWCTLAQTQEISLMPQLKLWGQFGGKGINTTEQA